MKSVFRPLSFWQSSLSTLPDGSFFELLRSVLGNIKTPFNKQRLLEDMTSFLARPEIQDTIAAFLDGEDRRIIAAIALLGEPAPGELESFFAGDYSYARLHSMLLNLEERLIIYRFRDEDTFHMALNPRLREILAPIAADRSVLFPLFPAEDPAQAPAEKVLDDRLLASLITFFLSGELFFRGETAGFRKRVLDEGERLFPGFDLEILAGAFLTLGVLIQDGDWLAADEKRLDAFKKSAPRTRRLYLAAAIALTMGKKDSHRGAGELPFAGRSLLKNLVRLCGRLLSSLEVSRRSPPGTLVKLVEILRRDEIGGWGFGGELPPSPLIVTALETAGLFYEHSGGNSEPPVSGGIAPVIAMDADNSCILYPEISFADALDLGAFASVEETGITVRFSLTRESVVRGFDRRYGADRLRELLRRLSGGRSGGALDWNLTDWEKRYREVTLDRGTVLVLGGDRSYLAGTEPLASMIRRELAPGVFLLTVDRTEAEEVLRSAGVDIVGRPGISGPVTAELDPAAFFPGPLEEETGPVFPEEGEGPAAASYNEAAAARRKEQFRAVLEKTDLSRREKDELTARIDRRIVISDSQLKDASIRYEKLEARSLDFVGKTVLVKQAMESGSLLEVNWNDAAGGHTTLTGTPESLEKRGGEMVLILKPRHLKQGAGEGTPVRIPLGKISLLRRIKQSIFGE